jgi:hypothetical protein
VTRGNPSDTEGNACCIHFDIVIYFQLRNLVPQGQKPKGRANYVTIEGSAPCTTSIIENENRPLLSNLKDEYPILHRPKISENL